MTRPLAIVVALLALTSLGASCSGQSGGDHTNGRPDPNPDPDPDPEPRPGRSTELDQIDTSELTSSERRQFFDLVNDQLSPCGEPVSVARCVAESRRCNKCVPAARYLTRLVAEGYERAEIEELFSLRYGRDHAQEID